MTFAACVILYHPKEEDLKNIFSYLDKVEKLYVFDNTENKSIHSYFETYSKIEYYSDHENLGLSIRLNQAANLAILDNYDYLLTMDQDSYFLEINLETYFNDIKIDIFRDDIGIYGLEHSDSEKETTPNEVKYSEVHDLITSGSVLNLKNFMKIGGFDEKIFIDGVDIDFCLATIQKGYKCIAFKNNFFVHSLGENVKTRSFKTLYLISKNKRLHSPIRIYYMKRNMLYLEKKYKATFPEYIDEIKTKYHSLIQKNRNYSSNIYKLMKYERKAILDFKNQKMGKIS